jgi:hypothetical protein
MRRASLSWVELRHHYTFVASTSRLQERNTKLCKDRNTYVLPGVVSEGLLEVGLASSGGNGGDGESGEQESGLHCDDVMWMGWGRGEMMMMRKERKKRGKKKRGRRVGETFIRLEEFNRTNRVRVCCSFLADMNRLQLE